MVENLQETINRVMQQWGARNKEQAQDDPRVLLGKIFTKKELSHVSIRDFSGGVFYLNVDSSTWLYHLNLKKEGILARLRQVSGKAINDIRFNISDRGVGKIEKEKNQKRKT